MRLDRTAISLGWTARPAPGATADAPNERVLSSAAGREISASATVFHVEHRDLPSADRPSRSGACDVPPAGPAATASTFDTQESAARGGGTGRAALDASAAGVKRATSGRARALTWPVLALLWVYRRFVSPVLPPACRYHPSCSQYAFEAVAVHGPVRGTWLAARRLLRCHPWAPGGPDPVPPARVRPDPERVPK